MTCTFCASAPIYAQQLCATCYQRKQRTGKLEYTRKFIKPTDQCSVAECYGRVIASGMCEAHYRMTRKRGAPVSDFGYGSRSDHPLYGAWQYQVRVKEKRVPEWDDFWIFVGDVGEKPSPRHVCQRPRVTEPWGPKNFSWALREPCAGNEAELQRRWRAKNPLRAKRTDLMRNYGLSLEDYLAMYDAQGGACAICKEKKESFASGADGRVNTLAVDHCHKPGGKVRALLCAHCNKALGGFKDSPELLRAAADYIEHHRLTPPKNPDTLPATASAHPDEGD